MAKQNILRSTGIIAVSTFGSRILGFIRDMVVANFFGAGRLLDAFFIAFRIPNLFRRLVAEGSLTIAFIPVYTDYLENKKKEEALELAQKMFSILLLVLTVIVALGIIFSPQIVDLFAYGFTDPYIIKLTVSLNRMMFPYLFLISLVAFCMGYLNSHRMFFAPAASPMLLNVGMIFGAVVLRKMFSQPLYGLALGVIIGGTMQLMLQLPYMVKAGFKMKISVDFKHEGIKKINRMIAAAFVGGAIWQINILVNTMLASMLPDGSVSYLYYSDRLTELVLGIFVTSIGNVILPELSSSAAVGDISKLKKLFSDSLRASLFFSIPTGVALVVIGSPIINVLFMRGKFNMHDVDMTYWAMLFAAPGVISVAVHKILVATFYSLKDTKTPVVTSGIALVSNAVLGYFFMHTFLKHGGLTLSNSIAVTVQIIILMIVLKKKINMEIGREVLTGIMKIVIASAAMGASLYFFSKIFNWDGSFAVKATGLAVTVAVSGFLYALLCRLFKIREIELILKMVEKIISKLRPKTSGKN